VLGGARSGKSSLAESLLADITDVTYVATGGGRLDDPDWRARVQSHQSRRPSEWNTEATTDLVGLLRTDGPPLLIDCLTLWLTAVMDDAGAWDETVWHASGRAVATGRVDALVAAWRTTGRRVVAVSNEVGSGVVPETWAGRVFRDEMGRLNARLAVECDSVSLVVAGIETRLR
jgi:adenosylcobinamide kinase/adenosylcobinamide-phosphate guanylyltransferase